MMGGCSRAARMEEVDRNPRDGYHDDSASSALLKKFAESLRKYIGAEQ